MAFTNTFDTATPAGSDDPAEADDRMREIKAAVQEREDVDHYWPLTGTEVSDAAGGEHRKLTIRTLTPTEVTALTATKAYLYRLSTDGELYFKDDDDNTIQLTSGGYILGSSILDDSIDEDAIRLANNAYLKARNQADDGNVNIIRVGTDDLVELLGTAIWMVADAPTHNRHVANKKYVDDQVAAAIATATEGDTAVTVDSESNTMLKSHAYLAQTSGFVTAWAASSYATLKGFVGATTDPAGAGVQVGQSQVVSFTYDPFISFFVPNGKYFEVTLPTDTPTITWTPVVTGGDAPVDNN